MIEILKSILIGIIQGITEWLPVSSTGHMILLDELLHMDITSEFKEMFFVVIQLGSIMAVLTLYFHKLNPFSPKKSADEKKQTWTLWFRVILAAVPAAILGLLFDDWFDAHFYNYVVVAIALIVYGVAFLLVERRNKNRRFRVTSVYDIDAKTALGIGAFQCLSLIPGTSRSGSTILGSTLIGVSREAAAEFSFFLAIPVMLGASALKLLKFGFAFTGAEIGILLAGVITAFLVSVVAIRFLMGFVRSHTFAPFGWYRIALGAVVLLRFALL
ncbi:MAG: undecaprenyl-diphosphate phosphatase [Clostridia bacterium]|nr:undecaprenyl-diphosphate phosphatase [Clostridia bacterium]